MKRVEEEDLVHQHRSQRWRYYRPFFILCQGSINIRQGVGGLSARDIKLIVEGGFHTVESVAYT